MKLSEVIKEARKKKGRTVYDLARELGLKSPGYVSRIEGIGEIPGPDMVIKLSEVLGLNVETMMELAASEKASESSRQVHEKFENAIYLYRKSKKA